jgi:hypothetical protein
VWSEGMGLHASVVRGGCGGDRVRRTTTVGRGTPPLSPFPLPFLLPSFPPSLSPCTSRRPSPPPLPLPPPLPRLRCSPFLFSSFYTPFPPSAVFLCVKNLMQLRMRRVRRSLKIGLRAFLNGVPGHPRGHPAEQAFKLS